MKTIKKSLILSFVLLVCVSCNMVGGVKPSDNYITRNYKVAEFDQMKLNTVGNINFLQSTDGTTSVKIYGPDNILDLIEVSVKNRKLFIEFKKKNQIKNVKKMQIDITSPNLSGLEFEGVGNIDLGESLSADELGIRFTGVGNLVAKGITCQSIHVSSNGVGDVNLSGKSESVTLSNNGVGNISASKLEGNTVHVSAKGVGNVTCWANEYLKASTSGVGSIKYKGNPSEKNLSKNGVGSIKSF